LSGGVTTRDHKEDGNTLTPSSTFTPPIEGDFRGGTLLFIELQDSKTAPYRALFVLDKGVNITLNLRKAQHECVH
jgi:hypothetical protein